MTIVGRGESEPIADNSTSDGQRLNRRIQFFLENLLAAGPVESKTIKSDAEGAGHSWSTVRRAQKALKIKPRKGGMTGGWQWDLPGRCSPAPEVAQPESLSTFDPFEHLHDGDDIVEVEL